MKKSRILCFILAASFVILPSCDKKKGDSEDVKVFTGFFAAHETPIQQDNEIQKKITELTGAKCIETWLKEEEDTESIISRMIISGEYPDFIYPDDLQHQKLLEAKAYIPIDEYWDEYPRLKNYFTEDVWDRLREDDGHIYVIPPFSNVYMKNTDTIHTGEAFWIQLRVLKWDNYPEIKTLDQYFDLINRYLAANPTDENGNANIGYEILSDGWLYFCLENPPQFLAGYPNDGCCIVDKDTLEAIDYNTIPEAKRWFKKLNEEYKKGTIDPECFMLTAEQYYNKLASGNVLGMVDQQWNFANKVEAVPPECSYIPLGLVLDANVEEHYHSQSTLDVSKGLGISVSCSDVEGAVKFINDLLDPEVHNLRYWGIEGEHYMVNSDGLFYLTDEQHANALSTESGLKCSYSYFPNYTGMNQDEINACAPDYQPSEFYSKLSDEMKECFDAYNAKTYVDLLNPAGENEAWFPMWSYSNTFTDATDYGKAKNRMDEIKHEYLPKVVMSADFEKTWEEYMQVYKSQSNVEAYLKELTAEIRRRVEK